MKDAPKNAQWASHSGVATGTEAWHAPESWGVQPLSTSYVGPPPKAQVVPVEEDTSDDMEQSDYEWSSYGKKKLSTIRIFRADTTYTTVNCGYNITASELSSMLCRKIFKPDTSKYHLYVCRNNVVRPLGPYERPLQIMRKCLEVFGYTPQDKLDELSGKDNSFLCRFTFLEDDEPLVTNQHMDLPLDFVQNCSSLKWLEMAYNDLDKIPSNVRYITNLNKLDIKGNRIKDLETAYLHEARKLDTLILQCNRLESIPDTFKTFQCLRVVNLSSNNFTKFPQILCKITTLEELDLSFNTITEIPADIGHLKRLKNLLLFGNKIGTSLPKSMEDLTSLRKLDIRQNGILNLDALSDMQSLEHLLVDYNTNVVLNNSFGALVRASVVKCNITDINIRGTGSTLVFLDLSSNKLSNLVPGLFEHLQSLETLKLDNNSISSIPGTIGALKHLRTLSVANNSLNSIPDEIAQLDSLLHLDVHSNSLSELPASIWKCSLESLNASSNILESFPFPPEDVILTKNGSVMSSSSSAAALPDAELQAITQGKNTTSPPTSKPLPAPPTIAHNPSSNGRSVNPPLSNTLQSLYLGDNRLPDDVFDPLAHFTSLKVLNLSHNFIAEIPRGQIPSPGNLVELYLGGNQLTHLPADDIEALRNLSVLYRSGNKLTTLPAELGKINNLVVLDVGCNMLKYNISNWPYDWNW
ncbi:cysteinyl-tRNA synthetase [Modicella reniformis]|uniref:Cysteinyl-tRNA synthetase n=1 Tax=Modicella reniformis TaxID=1440133 RepID=A0A9P6ITZ9_9FUNG|nr:cysteinyl-tRNA synthetase [Modicella reniformis]